MCWVDSQPAAPVEAQAAPPHVAVAPSPDLEPQEVVEAQLAAFQRGSNEDIEELWQLVAPDSELEAEYWSSAGAMSKFRWKVRKEPRWKNIGRRPCAALMFMRKWEVLGVVMTDADRRIYRVKASPFFPDAPHAESEVVFQWTLHRQRASHPSAKEALGPLDGCWLVTDIAPDYQGWAVADPDNAEKVPDTFKKPPPSVAGYASERWGV